MKNYKDSDYALNKFSEGIVYRFADGIKEITLADYLTRNPDNTAADFRALKELSDSIYLDQAQSENAQTKKNAPFYELDETLLCQSPSPEDVFFGEIDAQNEAERYLRRLETARRVLDTLTDIQKRRYLMHHVRGMTIRKIAVIEKAHFTTIYGSLQAADKKIKKVLADS